MARISLYHFVISSLLSSAYLGKLVEEGPLIVRALICSARVSWATVARVVASDWSEDTVVVRAVISEEFWARMRFCCSKRAWRDGSRDAGAGGKVLIVDGRDGAVGGGGGTGCCVREVAGGDVRDGAIGGGGGTGWRVMEVAVRRARMLIADARFSAIRDFWDGVRGGWLRGREMSGLMEGVGSLGDRREAALRCARMPIAAALFAAIVDFWACVRGGGLVWWKGVEVLV